MGFADNRYDMVLAMGFQADIADQHDLVVAIDFLERTAKDIGRVFLVALEEILPGAHHAIRGVDQAFPARVFPDKGNKRPNRLFRLVTRRDGLVRALLR